MTDSEIKTWLKQHKKTQLWLAGYLSVDLKTVGKWLNGVHKMPPYLRANIEHIMKTALFEDSLREAEKWQQSEHQSTPDSPKLIIQMGGENEDISITHPRAVEQFMKAKEEGMTDSEFFNQVTNTLESHMEGLQKKDMWLSKKEITDDDLHIAAAAINTTPQKLIEFILTKAAIKLAKDIAPE